MMGPGMDPQKHRGIIAGMHDPRHEAFATALPLAQMKAELRLSTQHVVPGIKRLHFPR
jgi:hypothetical protein